MNPHFFTAPFYFAFIWFKVQGSGFRWRLRRILDNGIPVSPAFPSRGRCPVGAYRALAV